MITVVVSVLDKVILRLNLVLRCESIMPYLAFIRIHLGLVLL